MNAPDNALATVAIATFADLERAAAILAPVFNLTTQQAMAIMLISQADGIHPVRGIRLYDIIEGKPAPKATTVLTWFQERGGRVDWVEYTGKRAAGFFSHPEKSPEPKLFELTIEEARERGLHEAWNRDARCMKEKHNWKHHGAAMLRARVVTAAVRMIDPGALNGQHIADELEDALIRDAEVIREVPDAKPGKRRTAKAAKEVDALPAEAEGAAGAAPEQNPAAESAPAVESAAVDGPGEEISPSPEVAGVTVATSTEPPPARIKKIAELVDLAGRVLHACGDDEGMKHLKTITAKYGQRWVKDIPEAHWQDAAKAMDDAMGVQA